MSQLEKLSEVTGQVLYGLTADERLKKRIADSVTAGQVSVPGRSRRLVPLLCGVTAVLIIMLVGLGTGLRSRGTDVSDVYFTSATHTSVSPFLLRSFLSSDIGD